MCMCVCVCVWCVCVVCVCVCVVITGYVDLRVPILLPGVMCNGQAQRSGDKHCFHHLPSLVNILFSPSSPVTLYDHICIHLCTLVTSLSARHYNQLVQPSFIANSCHFATILPHTPSTHPFLIRTHTTCAHTHTQEGIPI